MCEFFSFVQHRNHGFHHGPLGRPRTDSHTTLVERAGWSDSANVRGELLIARWEYRPDGTPNVEDWKLVLDEKRREDWMDDSGARAYAVEVLHDWYSGGCDRVSDVGTQEWYRDGKWHRDDGPAVIWSDGAQSWYRDGERHRDDGPAVIWSDGAQEWYRDGKRHREDGPAVICANGSQYWYRDGKRHREDGPAVIWASGSQEWYRDGKLHRDDGPAVIWADGAREWYRDGRRFYP